MEDKVKEILKHSRTGIGGCEASLEMLEYAREKGVRVIDSGRG